MKTAKKWFDAACSLLLAAALVLTFLPATASAAGTPESSVTLTFTNSGVRASGEEKGYEIDGTALKITEAGVYTLTGSCSGGSVTVKKEVTGVTLVLNGLTLTNADGAPLTVNKNAEATLYLVGANTLTNDEDPANETSSDAAVAEAFDGAAVKVKADAALTFTGTGTLNLKGNAKNGLKAGDNAVLTFTDGVTLNITAANDGINTNSDLTLAGGTFVISAGDDGIHSDAGLTVDGADITITKSNEGLEGVTIVLNSGTGSITASDDGINAAADGTASSLTVNGGVWYVDAGGDGLDAGGDSNSDNGTITFNGGTVTVYGAANNGNAAFDAGRGITWNGGTVLAVGMSGMAETPSGTGVVAFGASGMGGGMMGGMRGQMPQDNTQSGGAQNGQQPPQMPDGQTPQQGGMRGGFGDMQQGDMQPPQMGGGQMPQMGGMRDGFGGGMPPQMGDRNGQQPPQTGGDTQQGGMQNGRQNAQTPQTDNQQSGGISITKGSAITVTDSSGSVLISATGVKNANSVVFASDAVKEGETYTLTVDGKEAATATAGSSGTGGMRGGFGGQAPQQGEKSDQSAQSGTGAQSQKSGQSGATRSTVVVSPQSLTVDDAQRKAEAYNIDGSNYFKLRDLAVLLGGTKAQFNVVYDSARNTVVITTGTVYVVTGGELTLGNDASASAVKSAQSVEINGKTVDLVAYNIGGSNFFKLRDLGAALGFGVGYDAASNTAQITSI